MDISLEAFVRHKTKKVENALPGRREPTGQGGCGAP